MCAALANVEEDNWEWHTFDTIKGGDYLVDQDAAEIMCKEAIDAVLDLEKMGLPFNRTPEGRIDQRRFGGHTRNHGEAAVRRSCYAADRTGHAILHTLYGQSLKQKAEFYIEYFAIDLLMDDDGQITDAHSISAGLDYPGIGPEHSWLKDMGRVEYVPIKDDEALEAFQLLTRTEGIIPALEPSHALAEVIKADLSALMREPSSLMSWVRCHSHFKRSYFESSNTVNWSASAEVKRLKSTSVS